MFEQTFVDAAPASKKGASMLVSVLAQLFVLCALIAVPLLYTHGLPQGVLKALFVAPPVPRAASVPKSPPVTPAPKVQPRLLDIRDLVSRPVSAVKPQGTVVSTPVPDVGVAGGSGKDIEIPGVMGSISSSAAPPPAPEPKHAAEATPLRVGGHAEEANLIRKVMPVYPTLAKSAHVQGSVEFTALISKDGTIENLQLVRGHPLLVTPPKKQYCNGATGQPC